MAQNPMQRRWSREGLRSRIIPARQAGQEFARISAHSWAEPGTCSLAETFSPSPGILPAAERVTALVAGAGPAPDTVTYPALSQGNSPSCPLRDLPRLLQRKSL